MDSMQVFRPAADGVITVAFLLVPEFSMVALLSAIEPMRVANRIAKREIFRWQLLAPDAAQVYASNGLTLQPCTPLSLADMPANIFVCASFHPERYLDPVVIAWLQKVARQGALLGAVDTGCYLLQAAGLIKHQRITLHWEAIPAFCEQFPGLEVTSELFEIDHDLVTCAGGTAALDLMLHVIQAEFGQELAVHVCEQFIKSGIRQKSDAQRIDLAARLGVYHPRLLLVVACMEQHLEEPLSQEDLAEQAKVSVRQLERLFRQYLQQSPAAYYLEMRLNRARALLLESRLTVADVALACGFVAVAHFSRAYRRQFGYAPSAERPVNQHS